MRPTKEYSRTSWIDPRVEVRPSPIEGKGTFTLQAITEGETVFIWGGTVFTQAEIRTGKARKHSVAEIGEGLYLASPLDEPESSDDFMNHSCDPNIWMQDEVTLVARRDIESGEELTADYAMWSTDPDWVLHKPCDCGSPLCRKRITGNDWKLEALQGRHRDHFSPYINERIRNWKRR